MAADEPSNASLGQEDLFKKISQAFLRTERIRKGETVVVGVSGGMDSMCLLDILARLRPSLDLQLVVAHLHHGLRGEEADQELRFVEREASRYGAPFEWKRMESSVYGKGENIQAQARTLRYAFFEDVASRWNAQKIATGHHRDDQVETLLLQLFRGTGSLTGIHPFREGRIIRPLLQVGRSDIVAYVRERSLSYRTDSSNTKRTYLRNRIRQELLPWLRQEVNPALSQSLIRFSSMLQEDQLCLDRLAKESYALALDPVSDPDQKVLKRDQLASLEPALRGRVIREAYRCITGTTQGLTHTHIRKISELLDQGGEGGQKRISLPGGVHLFQEYDHILMSRTDPWNCPPYEYPLLFEQERSIPEAGMRLLARPVSCMERLSEETRDPSVAFLGTGSDASCRMLVRNFRPGDRFSPAGMGGTKKLKDFFIDEKIPNSIRYRLPLLLINERIAWVVGYRVDERFKISKHTETCIKIEAGMTEQDSPSLRLTKR